MCTTLPTASPLYLNYKFLNVLNRSRILKDHNRAKLKVNLINNIKPIRVIIEYVSLNYISDIKRCFAEKIIYLYVMFDVLRGCSGSQPPRRPSHHGRMTLLYLLSTDINIDIERGCPLHFEEENRNARNQPQTLVNTFVSVSTPKSFTN